jgi:hypothetical protein
MKALSRLRPVIWNLSVEDYNSTLVDLSSRASKIKEVCVQKYSQVKNTLLNLAPGMVSTGSISLVITELASCSTPSKTGAILLGALVGGISSHHRVKDGVSNGLSHVKARLGAIPNALVLAAGIGFLGVATDTMADNFIPKKPCKGQPIEVSSKPNFTRAIHDRIL